MTAAVLIDTASLGMRWWGPPELHVLAVVLATLGLVLAGAAAYLGGHLVFGLGTTVNRNAFADGPVDYASVGPATEFPEGAMRRVEAGGMPVLVVRLNGAVHAIGAVCSHAGGPLEEGELDGHLVTCPWHGSRFDVTCGSVEGGPATFGQPPLIARERDGKVEVRLAHPMH
jgi:nitrite reductase/ring-hydroxylating ferredoxin subunit